VIKKRDFLFLLFFLPSVSNGQLYVGLQAGYGYFDILQNQSGVTYSNTVDHFLLTLEAGEEITQHFTVAIGAKYLNQAYHVNANTGGLGGGEEVDLSVHYGLLNFIFKPEYVFGKKVKGIVYPGILVGIVLHSTQEGTKTSWSMSSPAVTTDTVSGSAHSLFQFTNFGFLIGLGCEIPVSNSFSFIIENETSITLTGPSIGSGSSHFLNIDLEVGCLYHL